MTLETSGNPNLEDIKEVSVETFRLISDIAFVNNLEFVKETREDRLGDRRVYGNDDDNPDDVILHQTIQSCIPNTCADILKCLRINSQRGWHHGLIYYPIKDLKFDQSLKHGMMPAEVYLRVVDHIIAKYPQLEGLDYSTGIEWRPGYSQGFDDYNHVVIRLFW